MVEPGGVRLPSRWLLRAPADDAGGAVVCIPYMGMGGSLFHRWPRRYGTVDVCPVQLPGRENRITEPAAADYGELARGLSEGIVAAVDRPFTLFGHCASAYVAFETVLALHDRGGPCPERLFVSSMGPPHEAALVSVMQLPDDEVPAFVRSLLRLRGVEEPEPEIAEMMIEVMRTDLAAYRRYQRQLTTSPVPITAVGWREDDRVPPDEVEGWSSYGDTEMVVLPGSHWSFMDAPTELLDLLTSSIRA